nr:hypothetical protein [Persicimonas caeni]
MASGRVAPRRPTPAIEVSPRGWAELQRRLPDDVDTLAGATAALGDAGPDIHNWVWDMLTMWRRQSGSSAEAASLGASFAEEIVARFSAEDDAFRRSVEAERAFLLGRAGRTDEAEAICRRHIDAHPEEARAYCTLADVLLDAEPAEPARALEVLEEAAARPVSDAQSWDLARRIEEAREMLRTQEMRASEHYVEWDQFWEAFDDAGLDQKFEMARERIDNAPDFDAEWAFALMVEGLGAPCQEEGRRKEWLETLARLRARRPEVAKQESGSLGSMAVEFALAGHREYLDEALALMFEEPASAPDLVLREFELLAYAGETGLLDWLSEKWPEYREGENLMPHAYTEWASWAALAQLAAWAEEDIDRAHTLQELRDVLGDMWEELDPGRVERYVTEFVGAEPARFDAASAAEFDDADRVIESVTFAFGRDLVDAQGWHPFKALLAVQHLSAFLEHNARCEDPFQDAYATKQAMQSKAMRRQLKALREEWREGPRFAPHPDLAEGFAEAVYDEGMFGAPYSAAAFFEAVVRLTPWLAQRGFIERGELVEAIQGHFGQRINDVGAKYVRATGRHPLLVRGFADAADALDRAYGANRR